MGRTAAHKKTTSRIILADDHHLFRRALRQLLEAEGYAVEAEATSGDEALTAVAGHPGCVLLLDIAMPGMNGLDVARRLAERGDDVRVVMLSAREDRDALFSAISAGARGYVAKDSGPSSCSPPSTSSCRAARCSARASRRTSARASASSGYAPACASSVASRSPTGSSRSCASWPPPPRRRRWRPSSSFQEDGAEPHLGDLPQAGREEPLGGHRARHGAAPHRGQGLAGALTRL